MERRQQASLDQRKHSIQLTAGLNELLCLPLVSGCASSSRETASNADPLDPSRYTAWSSKSRSLALSGTMPGAALEAAGATSILTASAKRLDWVKTIYASRNLRFAEINAIRHERC